MKSTLSTLCVGIVLSSAMTGAQAASITGQGTWKTTLQGRDLDGNLATSEAYYDTILDITWLADANYAQTSGFDADGRMIWDTAMSWAAGLTLGGYTEWRLPTVSPVDGTTADDATLAFNGTEDRGYNVSAPGTLYAGSTASEMAHLFYNTLGNLAYYSTSGVANQPGWGLSNTGPFSNVFDNLYWSATEYATVPVNAWAFTFDNGLQTYHGKSVTLDYAWAVHAGDVGASAVPVPAAAWLFGSGLLGLIGVVGRRKVQGA